MPVRKKYPKLPNGYGSIKYLGKKRRNPYAVHPPVEEFKLNGSPITPKALCYVDTWIKGFAVLTAYKAGTYAPGYEKTLADLSDDTADLGALAQKILADYNTVKGVTDEGKTFTQVYEEFFKDKFQSENSKKYSKATIYSTQAAYKNCASIHDKPFRSLKFDDLQGIVDRCELKHASLELIVSLFHQIYAYAEARDLCDKDYSTHVKIKKEDEEVSGEPFTPHDLKILWQNKENPIVEFILIMCYSGFRITAYQTLKVNFDEKFFCGGIKTKSGKNRIVPIHSAILPLVKRRIERDGCLLDVRSNTFLKYMCEELERLKIERHTPHDCRHTFSALCERYGVRENDRKRMLGHAFKEDITNAVYGHRTVDELREEIEKIKICY